MKKTILLLSILAIPMWMASQNQNFDFYSFEMSNMFNINPAYTGNSEDINIVLDAKAQAKSMPNSLKNLMAGVSSGFAKNQSIGGRLISDSRGIFQNLNADLTYAYTAKITDEHTVLFGLSAGILNKTRSLSKIENYQYLDQTDPTLDAAYYNSTQFIAGAGLLYKYKLFNFSLSFPRLIETTQPVGHLYNMAAFYTFKAGTNYKVTPWLYFQNVPNIKYVSGLFVKGEYKNSIWAQVGYQTNKTMNTMLGVNIGDFGLGYGFLLSNYALRTIAIGRNEVKIVFKIRGGANRSKTPENEFQDKINTNSLNTIIDKLDQLVNTPLTTGNRNNIRNEIETIKQQLQKTELENLDPKNVQAISEKLKLIDTKLKVIELKLKYEN